MERCLPSLLAVVVLGLTLPVFPAMSRADGNRKTVEVEKTWNGWVKLALRKEAPGYIADKETWANVWKLYRGDEKLPAVDFDKELVLVVENNDPNGISIHLEVDDKADLRVDYVSTEIEFVNPTTCSYEFALVKRGGFKSINGQPIPEN